MPKKKTPYELAREAFGKAGVSALSDLQKELHEWQVHNFGKRPMAEYCLGIEEEASEALGAFAVIMQSAGKLSHYALKHVQGIRGMESLDTLYQKTGDGVADMTIYALQLCTALRLDMYTLVLETAKQEVLARDWKRFPKNGTDA